MEPEIEYAIVRINYKSGHSETMKVKSFSWKKENGVMSVNWELYDPFCPVPIFMNVNEIESIWQIEVVAKEAT